MWAWGHVLYDVRIGRGPPISYLKLILSFLHNLGMVTVAELADIICARATLCKMPPQVQSSIHLLQQLLLFPEDDVGGRVEEVGEGVVVEVELEAERPGSRKWKK